MYTCIPYIIYSHCNYMICSNNTNDNSKLTKIIMIIICSLGGPPILWIPRNRFHRHSLSEWIRKTQLRFACTLPVWSLLQSKTEHLDIA